MEITKIKKGLPGRRNKFYQFNKPINKPMETALYYSAITITTLGYGDIRPIHWLSRIVSGIESIVGIFFIALVIGYFISHVSKERD